MHVAIDLCGSCESILITSTVKGITTSSNEGLEASIMAESGLSVGEELSPVCKI